MNEKDIIRDAAKMYGITIADMRSRKRNRCYADARAVACYILVMKNGYTKSEVGRALGRTHATVIYFVRNAEEWLRKPILNPRAARVINDLVERYKMKEQ